MSIQNIIDRLKLLFGDLITLKEGQEYIKMITPMIFIDKDYGEWTTSPNNVLNKQCTHPTRKLEKRKATNLVKYGVDNTFKSEAIKTKIKSVLIEKYGGDHPMHCESIKKKAEDTCLRNHGVKYALQNKEILAKTKETLFEKYGVEHSMQIDAVKEKVKVTCLERYGFENSHQSPEVIAKTIKTNNERYGGNAPVCDVKVKDKIKTTNQEQYGGGAPLCSPEIKAKVNATNLERYGAENPFASEGIKKKIAEVNIERYGVAHPAQNPEIMKKIEATCLERYGFNSPLKSPVIAERAYQTAIDNGHILVLPNGLTLGNYLRKYNRTDLNFTSCSYVSKKFGFEQLQEYVEGNKTFGYTTSLEYAMAELLQIQPYKDVIKLLDQQWKKPDFKIKENLYVDIDGLYWHSTATKKDPKYHFQKRLAYESNNLRLFQFRDIEIINKPDIVKSIINNQLEKNTTIFARKCDLVSVPWLDAVSFLEHNHLQGQGSPATSFGLYYKNELSMLICCRQKKDGIEISRLCTKNNYHVIGGFSRLLNAVKNIYNPRFIASWCDLRYANGKGYEKVGFKKIRDVLSWAWTDHNFIYHRLRCRTNMDDRKLTEQEYAKELGWYRLYDAGQRLYMKYF